MFSNSCHPKARRSSNCASDSQSSNVATETKEAMLIQVEARGEDDHRKKDVAEHLLQCWLLVEPTPLKNRYSSVGICWDDAIPFPTMEKKSKPCSKPPTNLASLIAK